MTTTGRLRADAPLAALMDEASRIRDNAFGTRITYSPKVFIPLTQLCRDRCGYCTFAQPPARLATPFMGVDEVLELAGRGAEMGCHEALFTLGEAPEDRWAVARSWLDEHGFGSTIDYLHHVAGRVLAETGLLPHANAGALDSADLARLRQVSASQGMMLESLKPDLECHRGAPDKAPSRRLATLDAAGKLRIPFTTGVLVGIGENRQDRIDALAAIAASHARHGHVQEVIVQNFRPKPGTAMQTADPCPTEEHLWTVAAARLLLSPDIHVQAPPNLADDLAALVAAGIDDWGGVSPLTPDHVNPERAWPALDQLRSATEDCGYELAPRLTVYPEFVAEPDRWIDPGLLPRLLGAADVEGLARDHPWVAGGLTPGPLLISPGSDTSPVPVGRSVQTSRARGAVDEVLAGVHDGHPVGLDEIVTLFSARGREVRSVAVVADGLRSEIVGDVVTWVANRNINYTNVCTFKCRFCAFSKGPLSLNLRGDPYLLDLDEIRRRVVEAAAAGATEVCLQGGIHPSFDGDYYIDVCRAAKEAAPDIHVHGFTALEVTEGARRNGEDLIDYLRRLQAVGLATLPGTAAEILDDEIRAILCPDKVDTAQWLAAHRSAHQIGLRSNITIMFGAVERPVHWARHLLVTRALATETGGFTEFVPLPFVHMAAPIWLQGRSRRGPTFREALLMHAVARITYRAVVPNIQVSWVKMGVDGTRQALAAGANDLGGTLMDENISRAAGAAHGQSMDEASFADLVAPLGRPLRQRTTLYGRVPPTTAPAPSAVLSA